MSSLTMISTGDSAAAFTTAVAKSVRNLRYAECAEVGALSTEQVLRARSLVLTEKAYAALNEA